MIKTIVATFENYVQAEKAARAIKDQGLKTDDISIVTRQGDTSVESTGTSANMVNNSTTSGVNATSSTTRETTNDNISDGVVTGGVLGGLAGLLLGAGSLIVPGLGAIAAAGPITGLLSGALTGGIVGGLVDLGIPEEQGKGYEEQIKQGRVLFSMKSDEANIGQVTSILKSNFALNVDTY